MKSLYPAYILFKNCNSLNLQHRALEPSPSANYDLGLSGEILSVNTSMIDL